MREFLDLEIEPEAGSAGASTPLVKDKDGRTMLAVVVKFAFRVSASGAISKTDEPPEVDLVDTYHGKDPATSSIRRPSQLFESKPGTDVILVGHAHPPPGGSATFVDVGLRVGRIAKTVRAHGLRVWKAGGLGGLSPGPARPIRSPVPLVYELAWGGQDLSDPGKPLGEPRNYVGRGVSRTPKELIDAPAAQLEYPDSTKNVPASFGPIHRHWQPRASYAGTYDDQWMESRMPLLPQDFDQRFNVCVPPDQWSEVPLRSDEPIEVRGATPEGIWRFQLPRIALGFSSIIQGRRQEHRTHLDTIFIDADERVVELSYRAAIRMPLKLEMVDRILVVEKEVL